MCRAAAGSGLRGTSGCAPQTGWKDQRGSSTSTVRRVKAWGLLERIGHRHTTLAQCVEQLGDACVGLGFGLPALAVLGFHRGLGAGDGSIVAGRGRQGAAHQVFNAVADKVAVRVNGMQRVSGRGERSVSRIREVGERVEQGAVEVENCGRKAHGRSHSGVT